MNEGKICTRIWENKLFPLFGFTFFHPCELMWKNKLCIFFLVLRVFHTCEYYFTHAYFINVHMLNHALITSIYCCTLWLTNILWQVIYKLDLNGMCKVRRMLTSVWISETSSLSTSDTCVLLQVVTILATFMELELRGHTILFRNLPNWSQRLKRFVVPLLNLI